MPFKKILKWVFRPHRYLRPPYIAYGKGKNWKFEFYSCIGQNVFQLTQKVKDI